MWECGVITRTLVFLRHRDVSRIEEEYMRERSSELAIEREGCSCKVPA